MTPSLNRRTSSAVLEGLLATLPIVCAACARGDAGAVGVGPSDPPAPPTPFLSQAGLDSIAAGSGAIRVDFTLPPGADHEVAVFVSTNRANLFTTAPRIPAAGEASLTIAGLADATRHFLGLGIRPVGGSAYEGIGPVLTATPGTPIYVDAAAPAGGDGATPATAINDLFTAVLTAFARLIVEPGVSVNVWVKGGRYDIGATLPITAGVNVQGGFGPAFDLASRDLDVTPTIWNVFAGQKAAEYADQLDNSLALVIDGVRITGDADGNGIAEGNIGLDTNATDPCDLELRSVIVTDMADRGLRLRNTLTEAFDVLLTNCQSSRNGADGLSGSGPCDYFVYNSTFAANFQEGLDLDGLVPEAGGTATLELASSRFFDNRAEGLDCTMKTPLTPSTGGFSVRVRGCLFERNRLAGCLIDADFESVPGYSAAVLVRESHARANLGQGFHLDLDGPVADADQNVVALVHRVLATGNGLDGLYVTSETRPGVLVVSTSAMIGNAGAGLRAEGPLASPGNRAVLVTHCLFAANSGGGMISRDVPASAVSTLAFQQPSPFDGNTTQLGDVVTDDPVEAGFTSAPEEYAHVASRSGSVLTLTAAPAFSVAATLELGDDSTVRAATSIAGTTVVLSEAPIGFSAPGILAAFAPAAPGVIEDYRLVGGSIALAAGLNGADAGLFGSPVAGAPGQADAQPAALFHLIDTAPGISDPVGADASIRILFSSALDGASANATTVRAWRGLTEIPVSRATAGALLTIDPIGDWGAGGFRVELDGLSASDGTPLSGAVAIPFSP